MIVSVTAYQYRLSYARVANKAYHLEQLYDEEVIISVSGYHEDEAIAQKQERILWSDLPEALASEYGPEVIDIEGMEEKTRELFSELFGNAGRSIGQWPNSSAYYGVDVVYDAEELAVASEEERRTRQERGEKFIPQPKLLEVNYLGDWHGLEVAVETKDPGLYHQFVNDLMVVLATDCSLESHARLVRL